MRKPTSEKLLLSVSGSYSTAVRQRLTVSQRNHHPSVSISQTQSGRPSARHDQTPVYPGVCAHSQGTGFLASVLLMMLMTLCRPLRHIFLLAAEFSRGSHEFQKCRAPCSTRELLSAMPPNLRWGAELLSLRDSATAKTSCGVRPRGQ